MTLHSAYSSQPQMRALTVSAKEERTKRQDVVVLEVAIPNRKSQLMDRDKIKSANLAQIQKYSQMQVTSTEMISTRRRVQNGDMFKMSTYFHFMHVLRI